MATYGMHALLSSISSIGCCMLSNASSIGSLSSASSTTDKQYFILLMFGSKDSNTKVTPCISTSLIQLSCVPLLILVDSLALAMLFEIVAGENASEEVTQRLKKMAVVVDVEKFILIYL
jgi:hypothetical protein